MKFVYPYYFYALLLLIIPILIHFFNFRKYKTIYFSDLYFIKSIKKEGKSVKKIKNIWLLISRLLFILSIILAFTQPYIPSKSNKSSNNIFIFYIDNSFSMQAKGTTGDLLTEAKEELKKILKQVPDNGKYYLLTNQLSGIESKSETKKSLLKRIEKIKFIPISRPLDQVIEFANHSIDNQNINQEQIKNFLLFSDFQKNTCRVEKISSDSTNNYYPIQLIPSLKENISIDSVWFSSYNFKIKENNELHIRLKNYTERRINNLNIQLTINETKRNALTSINAKDFKDVVFNYSDLKSGLKKGSVSILDKSIDFDNNYYFSYEVGEKVRILNIKGENASDLIEKTYGLDDHYQIENIKESQFIQQYCNEKSLLILNGINNLNENIIEYINQEFKSNKNILIFPGKEINIPTYNKLLTLLNLPKFNSENTINSTIKTIQHQDPFFFNVFNKKPDNLEFCEIRKIYSTKENTHSYPIIQLKNKLDLFIHAKKSFLFTSCLDTSFSKFIYDPLFPVVLLRSAEISSFFTPLSMTLGKLLKIPVKTIVTGEKPIHIISENTDIIPIHKKIDNQNFISLPPETDIKAGIYELINDDKKEQIAINYSRQESDITYLDKQNILNTLSNNKLKNIHFTELQSSNNSLEIEFNKPIEYWRFFVLLAILFLTIEMFLLKFK
jgi:hypothetical protein